MSLKRRFMRLGWSSSAVCGDVNKGLLMMTVALVSNGSLFGLEPPRMLAVLIGRLLTGVLISNGSSSGMEPVRMMLMGRSSSAL